MQAIDESTPLHADDSQLLVRAKVRGLVRGYDARWQNHDYKPLAVEQYVESPILNPETNASSRTFKGAGKMDLLAERGGRRVLFDHKTTSDDIEDPNATYWRQLQIEGQASHYMLLEWLNGRKIDDAVWDVVRKPSISPKKLTKAEMGQVVSMRNYFGWVPPQSFIDTCRSWDGRETLDMYEARLAHDCTTERPERYFQRRPVPRLDSELLEYAKELWSHTQDIILTRREDRHVRNSGACMLYGSPCNFLGICSGYDSPDSDKWARKEFVHNELPIVNGDGRDLLTNSRIRCFQTCRKKHYLQYELGIERVDEQERESLYFGHQWHLALNAWWSAQLEVSNVNCNNSAGSELAADADDRAPAFTG